MDIATGQIQKKLYILFLGYHAQEVPGSYFPWFQYKTACFTAASPYPVLGGGALLRVPRQLRVGPGVFLACLVQKFVQNEQSHFSVGASGKSD